MVKLNEDIIKQLEESLKAGAPGEKARGSMSPPYRPQLTSEEIKARNPRESGVLLLLYEKEGLLYTVLTQRKQYDGVHGGQMSFPGGKKEKDDADLTHTALREAEEEIGVKVSEIRILGVLSELYIPPSNFLVHPVVGFIDKIGDLRPQKSEVEHIVEIPLEFLLEDKNINPETEIKLYNGVIVKVPAYIFDTYIIWGATAIMLSEFVFVLKGILDKK